MKKILINLFFICYISLAFSQQKDVFDIARKGTLLEMETLYKTDTNCVNETNKNGFNTLILACYSGNTDIVQFLIKNGVNIDYVSDEGTALMAAVVKGNIKFVNLLLEEKANINLTNSKGITALMYAVQFGNVEMVELLLKYDADKSLLDKNGKTAFEYAAFSGNDILINLLK